MTRLIQLYKSYGQFNIKDVVYFQAHSYTYQTLSPNIMPPIPPGASHLVQALLTFDIILNEMPLIHEVSEDPHAVTGNNKLKNLKFTVSGYT